MITRNGFVRTGAAIATMVAAVALAACGDITYGGGTPQPPPPPSVQLKDIVIPSLPSPFYHFEYDAAGRIRAASYASGLRTYDVSYDRGRISQVQGTLGNRDRLEYAYDDAGRVAIVKYINANDSVFTTLFFMYDGEKLVELERDRRVTGGFIIDKTMSFSYHADGNLRSIVEHRPPVDGVQDETTSTTTYSQYDGGINVDGFSLIHDDFFDHLVLLPGVQLQKGNPAREVRTGDGSNWTVDYTYTYDARNRPLVKSGTFSFTNGPDVGRTFQTRSEFSYY